MKEAQLRQPLCWRQAASRPSRAAASQSTDPRPRRPRSGSTPHDAVIADPAPHRSAPFWPALARQHTRLRRSARLARDRTANPVEQRPTRSFAPAPTPKIQAKAIRSPASAQLPQHSRRRQIPIAPAALSVPHTPRFRALTLFGRRLSERGDGLGIPASENLHKRRNARCEQMFSAVHPTADIALYGRHVSNVPPEAEPIRILRLDPPAPTMGTLAKIFLRKLPRTHHQRIWR